MFAIHHPFMNISSEQRKRPPIGTASSLMGKLFSQRRTDHADTLTVPVMWSYVVGLSPVLHAFFVES